MNVESVTPNRFHVSTGAKWEPVVGYSRAVRVGDLIEISGTTAVDAHGNILYAGDAYLQAKNIIEKLRDVLQALGSDLSDVVRTRIYVTDISRWEEVGRAHGEFFAGILPATSMVEVRNLIHPDMLVEIEATAVFGSGKGNAR